MVAGALLLTLPLIGTWGLQYHLACERGSELAYADFWTPLVLLNAPFHGTANATGTLMLNGEPMPEAAGSIQAVNGSSEGLFGLVEYLIYPTYTDLALGAGSSARCTGSLVAVVAGYFVNPQTAGAVTPVQLAGLGNTVTEGVQTGFTLDTYRTVDWGSVDYDTATKPEGNYTSCAGFRLFPVYSQLNVTVPYQNRDLRVVLTSIQVFYYDLPPPGNWLVQLSPSGTWAFDYSPTSC